MILVVDDSAPMRQAIRTILSGSGEEILESSNGADAVDLYIRCRPSWVLMDIRMDRVDGIAATRTLKALDPEARIIIVTNYDDPQLRVDAKEAGAFAYVLKDDLAVLLNVMTPEEP